MLDDNHTQLQFLKNLYWSSGPTQRAVLTFHTVFNLYCISQTDILMLILSNDADDYKNSPYHSENITS